MCNGVAVYCQNHNGGGGADESGGPSAEPNYWWKPYDGVVPNDTPLCSANAGDFGDICCLPGLVTCFSKSFNEGNNPIYSPSLRGLCVGQNFPAPVDPLVDWVSGNYPSIDDDIRAACSARCENLDDGGFGPGADPQCEDDNWSALQTAPSWVPAHGYDCVVTMQLNGDDPDGSEVPWHLAGGSTAPLPLDCALDGDCAFDFYPDVAQFVLTPGAGDFIEPETRHADYLAVEASGSNIELDLDMPGFLPGIDDTESLFGLAEYTALDCGESVCPFYLANLSAYNTTDSWDVQLQLTSGAKAKKSITNVQIDLMQSTLGVYNPALEMVAFAPGSLQLRVQVDIERQETKQTSFGDGTHAAIVENDDYVFAHYDAGALSLTHTFTLQDGEATLSLVVMPDEHPPVASHDLSSTEACDKEGGLGLDTHVTSTDPDADIELDVWWIDGAPCVDDCVLPYGSHQVAVQAHDARGAVDRSAATWVYVATGCN